MNYLLLRLFYKSEMSMSDFCDKHGISQSDFRNYRDGKINIKFNTLEKIAQNEGYSLNVTLEPR